MYAVIKAGGKQYRVAQGDKITIEKVDGQAGDKVALETLMVGTSFGAGAVEGEIVTQTRGDKVIVFKKKRRQNYRRKNGHRQEETLIQITAISA